MFTFAHAHAPFPQHQLVNVTGYVVFLLLLCFGVCPEVFCVSVLHVFRPICQLQVTGFDADRVFFMRGTRMQIENGFCARDA